jgi:hypothetical protein
VAAERGGAAAGLDRVKHPALHPVEMTGLSRARAISAALVRRLLTAGKSASSRVMSPSAVAASSPRRQSGRSAFIRAAEGWSSERRSRTLI